tara:strand:- start:162 stop:320 length:159 start_codon:yes stop_codon:yes gene_type:complete
MENETEEVKAERLKKRREARKVKVDCPYCNKPFSKSTIAFHKKNSCPNRPNK